MTKIIAAAAASLLSLAACADTDDTAETETTIGETETGPIDSGAADTMGTATTTDEMDGDGVRVGVDENGIRADVRDGDTSVQVDADGNPSADIRID